MAELECGARSLNLSLPQVMGIINSTPDSFSDGGRFHSHGTLNRDAVLAQVESMVSAGASMIDIGGESTRPGAASVGIEEELDRVVPLVEAINQRFDIVISVDTSSPQVMLESAAVGAGFINDVRALQREGAVEAAASTNLPVCLMHMQGSPQTMQAQPEYLSVVDEVKAFLSMRLSVLQDAGIAKNKILLDPGFGFGKTLEHNLQLLKQLPAFESMGLPVLVGVSRKSMFGELLGRDVDKRLAGSLSAALIAVQGGAKIIRVHDVPETVDVLKLWQAVTLAN
jgi:dihydropteroate synthase